MTTHANTHSMPLLAKFANFLNEAMHHLMGRTPVQPAPVMTRRQQLAAAVDAAKRARRR